MLCHNDDRELNGYPINGENPQIELALSMSQYDSHLRLFHYAAVDDGYGFIYEQTEENLDRFIAGHDQAAFDRVMAIAEWQSDGKSCDPYRPDVFLNRYHRR